MASSVVRSGIFLGSCTLKFSSEMPFNPNLSKYLCNSTPAILSLSCFPIRYLLRLSKNCSCVSSSVMGILTYTGSSPLYSNLRIKSVCSGFINNPTFQSLPKEKNVLEFNSLLICATSVLSF